MRSSTDLFKSNTPYLMFSLLTGWRGLASGSRGLLSLAAALTLVALTSATTGVKTMSFEAKALATLCSLLDAFLSRRQVGGPGARKPARRLNAFKRLRAFPSTLLTVTPAAAWAPASALQLSMNASAEAVAAAARPRTHRRW